MKSMTKKFSLLLILSAVLFLSSCLDSGSQSYIGTDEYSFITRDETSGLVYAKTPAAYFITSPKISLLTPGSIVLLTYQVTEETETIAIGENGIVHKVILGAEPKELSQKSLELATPPNTDTIYFESIIEPPVWVTNSSLYFGDRWPLTYQYKAKKGENMRVSFYKVSDEKLPENLNADVLIDIRIEKFGVPEDGAKEELKNDLIVANMSLIRGMPTGGDNQETKQLGVKFRFFRADKPNELHISDRPITITVQK